MKKKRRSPRWKKLIVDGQLVSVYPVSLEGQKERRMAHMAGVQLLEATRVERKEHMEKFGVPDDDPPTLNFSLIPGLNLPIVTIQINSREGGRLEEELEEGREEARQIPREENDESL